MKVKRIIPCLDVCAGRVVKGVNFENLRDAGDPVELAAYYDQAGADELIFLDIMATSEGRQTMVDLVAKTVQAISIPLGVGGGIRDLEGMRRILAAGAAKVVLGSAAVKDPTLIAAGAKSSAASALSRRSMRGKRVRGSGGFISTAARNQPSWMLLPGPSKWKCLGRGRSF